MSFDLKTKINEIPREIESYEEFEAGYSEEDYFNGSFHEWRTYEHDPYSVGKKFYIFATIFLGSAVTYALFANSPIMAITFILIGVVGYLFLNKDPKIVTFRITHNGIIAGNEIYEFDNLKSFWIYYDPPHEKILSLRSKSTFTPFIHIPIEDEDPVHIRKILIDFIPEMKQQHNIVDSIERFLHM